MKKALIFGALGIAGCGLVVSQLSAQLSRPDNKGQAALQPIIDELIEAANAAPDQVNTRIRLGYLLQQAGQPEAGARWLDSAIQIDPTADISNPWESSTSTDGAEGEPRNSGNIQDVWVCSLPNVTVWQPVGSMRAYSFGTTSANQGNGNLNWDPNTVAHPVISQNIYRLKNGRLDHVGMSWLKHGFCALQGGGCGTCKSAGSGCPPRLGPGCSDPYDSQLNGSQSDLGPHYQVNAVLGTYTLPHPTPGGSTIAGRLQVATSDIDFVGSGTRYFAEGQYWHPEDALDNTVADPTVPCSFNNASYREISFNGDYTVNFVSGTVQQKQGIYAWQSADPSVSIQNIDVAEQGRTGRFTIAYKVTNPSAGVWHYEYAIHNMNSDRSAAGFNMPLSSGVIISNMGFHDCPYHDGDGVGGVTYNGTDWFPAVSQGVIRWDIQTVDANANALRFGTMYNFWFDANTAPAHLDGTLLLFKSGPAANPTFTIQGPGPRPCPADLDGDGQVGASDLAQLLGSWGTSGQADLDNNGSVGASDLALLLGSWGPC